MKKKANFSALSSYRIEDCESIKGGIRASFVNYGGIGGSGFVDWGEIEIRSNYEVSFSHGMGLTRSGKNKNIANKF